MGAETRLQASFLHVIPDLGLRPLARVVQEVDPGDGGLKEGCRDPDDPVERVLRGGVQDVVAAKGVKAWGGWVGGHGESGRE
jgi:hypothetical protein